MRLSLHLLLGIILLTLSSSLLKATHIVGGEMNYTCLGNDEYEITLTIFRDCYNGDPNAWFDNPASIGIFNRDNQLLQEILIPLMNNDTLNPVLSGECFVVPPNVCVHTTTYRTTISLPPIIGGYQLAYQRCCRNQTIVNIVEPLATGATYGVTISEQALLECNSNPKFQEWPPLYICVDQPIDFDQSAIDIDGDSIVYRLCTPLRGANQTIPQPQPPNPPPYQAITWIDPPYDVNNMLNGAPGSEPLQINPQTGLLTGLPNTIGQFVVGICVEEYRDGKLISTTRRDFQYNVGICGQSVSSFFAPQIQCDDLRVDFRNTSEGADDFLWIFSDENSVLGTSNEVNPSYTFPDTGLYQVTLIAEPGESCQDTFIQQLHLKTNTLVPDFDLQVERCSDTLFLHLEDTSVDPQGMPIDWNWTVWPEGTSFQGQTPTLFTTREGEITVQLSIVAANGCEGLVEKSIVSNAIQAPSLSDTLQICQGDQVRIGSFQFPNYQFQWTPSASLDNANLPNPQASPESNTWYRLQVSNEAGCIYNDSVYVQVKRIVATFPKDTVICSAGIQLSIETKAVLLFQWSDSPDYSDLLGTEDVLSVKPMGSTRYYMRVEDEFGCSREDSVLVVGNAVDVEEMDTGIACLGDTLFVSFQNEDPTDELTVTWQPNPGLVEFDGLEAIVVPQNGGESFFHIEVENQFGCTKRDSIQVQAVDTSESANFFTVTQCSNFDVQFFSDSPNAIFYQWDFGDPAAPNTSSTGVPTAHSYSASGNYLVRVLIDANSTCRDTFAQEIFISEPKIAVDFDWDIQSCADTTVLRFENQSSNTQSNIDDLIWIFSDTIVHEEETVELRFPEAQEIQATLILISSDGCQDSLTVDIPIPVIETSLSDSLDLCYGDSISLNPNGNRAYQYQWTPDQGLDDPTSFNPTVQPLESTTYTVEISTLDSICRLTQDIYVDVGDPLDYQLPPDQVLCEEDFLLAANAGPNLTITWAADSLFQTVLGSEDSLAVQVESPTTFYLKLSDEKGCEVEDQITLDGQAIRIKVLGDESICIGDTAAIIVDAMGQDGLLFAWSPAEDIIGPVNSPSILVSPIEDKTYNLDISNAVGCTLDTMVRIQLFNFIPPLEITADQDTVREGESTQLQATENGGYIYQWQADPSLDHWDISNPIASPVETTTYLLDIRDQNGCLNQAFITIVVFNPGCLPPFIYVPNAFTPNGDGRNDLFKVYGDPIDEIELVVYDRWGEKVFESDQKDAGWDGTFRGKVLSPDVYAYYVRVACFDGQEYITKGNVTLIR